MKILLTGASGFIGSNIERSLARQCLLNNYPIKEWHSTVRSPTKRIYSHHHILDLSDWFKVKTLLEEIKPDIIIHTAANPTTKLDEINYDDNLLNNIQSTQNLLHFAPNGCRFINFSTILVYGNTPIRVHEDCGLNPTSVYGASKVACEALVSAYTNMGRLLGCNLRLSATVGPNLTHGILKDFINKIYSTQEEFAIFGDSPGSVKPFTHISDVVDVVCFMIKNKELIGAYNISPSDEISALDIANLVMSKTNITKPIKFLGENTVWAGDNKLLQIDGRKIETLGLNKSCKTSAQAIVRAVGEICS